MQRTRYLTTSLDTEKASIGLSREEFEAFRDAIHRQHSRKKRDEEAVTGWSREMLWNLAADVDLIQDNGEPFEIWMEYYMLEELYHLVGDCDVGVTSEFQDALREFEYLATDSV